MNNYPLASKVISIQILIGLAGLAATVGVGLAFLTIEENESTKQFKGRVLQAISPNYETYISWRLLRMQILDQEFDSLKNNLGLDNLSVVSKDEASKIHDEYSIVIPDPNVQRDNDFYIVADFGRIGAHFLRFRLLGYGILFTTSLASLLFIFFFNRKIKSRLFSALKSMDEIIAQVRDGKTPKFSYPESNDEFSRFAQGMRSIYEITKQVEESNAQLKIASQVAHDIRSPLSALALATKDFDAFSSDKSSLIQKAVGRINDIANDLLLKSKEAKEKNRITNFAPISVDSFKTIIESVIQEKQMQYNNRPEITIRKDIKCQANSLVLASKIELERILSNLINNSVEAIKNETLTITVAVRTYKDLISILVQDDGIGMPADVLEKLGQPGLSLGKSGDSGHGIAIPYAKKAIESWGGKITFRSQPDLGTIVEVSLNLISG